MGRFHPRLRVPRLNNHEGGGVGGGEAYHRGPMFAHLQSLKFCGSDRIGSDGWMQRCDAAMRCDDAITIELMNCHS
jgi:hypothetical protein